mmetsp:Transcript_33529/g.107007  ORF Transcript_33529/g.107007 Transcript_33529/m.107007 type:complete len:389 (-) Transcript_33529:59-1225(-)
MPPRRRGWRRRQRRRATRSSCGCGLLTTRSTRGCARRSPPAITPSPSSPPSPGHRARTASTAPPSAQRRRARGARRRGGGRREGEFCTRDYLGAADQAQRPRRGRAAAASGQVRALHKSARNRGPQPFPRSGERLRAALVGPEVADGPEARVGARRQEGLHVVAVVAGDDAREGGDGARDLRLGEEAEEAQHREAAVVGLGDEPLCLLLGRRVLAPLERVKEVEWHRVHVGRKGGEVAGLAAAHVVLHAVGGEEVLVLGDVLEDADRADDLELRKEGDRVPHLRRRRALRHHILRADAAKAEAVRVRNVADEAGHRDAAVLNLGVAQPADNGVLVLAPERQIRQAKRVPVPHHWVALLREGLQIGLGRHDRAAHGRAGRDSRSKRERR